MADTAPETTLFTTPQAASFLGIHPTWLEHARVERRGPRFIKIGRNVRYRHADLVAFLEANVVQTSNRI